MIVEFRRAVVFIVDTITMHPVTSILTDVRVGDIGLTGIIEEPAEDLGQRVFYPMSRILHVVELGAS